MRLIDFIRFLDVPPIQQPVEDSVIIIKGTFIYFFIIAMIIGFIVVGKVVTKKANNKKTNVQDDKE